MPLLSEGRRNQVSIKLITFNYSSKWLKLSSWVKTTRFGLWAGEIGISEMSFIYSGL